MKPNQFIRLATILLVATQAGITLALPVQEFRSFEVAVKSLGQEIPIELVKNRLDLKLPANNDLHNFGQKIIGPLTYGSSSSGGNSFMSELGSKSLYFFVRSNLSDDGAQFERVAVLEQAEAPFQRTQISQNASGLNAVHLNPSNGRWVWLSENKEQTSAWVIEGAKIRGGSSRNFEQLSINYDLSALISDFQSVGISLPLTAPWDETSKFIGELLDFDENNWAEFLTQYKDLDGGKFDDRKVATERLKSEIEKWKAAITYGLTNPETSTELRARLRSVVLEDLDSPVNLLIDSLVNGKLLDDPRTLIRFLDSNKDKVSVETRHRAYERLRAATGQTMADELEPWQAWLNGSNEAKNSNSPGRGKGSEEPGVKSATQEKPATDFDSNLVALSKLMQLTLTPEGSWQFDRAAWSQQFGGVPAQELLKKAAEQFRETNLPEKWLRIGQGQDISMIDYPQILFEKYDELLNKDFQKRSKTNVTQTVFYGNSNPKTRNRSLKVGSVEAKLRQHTERDLNAPEQYCLIEVCDLSELGRIVFARQELKGQFHLFVTGPMQRRVLVLGEIPGKESWMHFIVDGDAKTFSAPTARQLLDENSEFFKKNIHPFVAELGINLSQLAGGPIVMIDRKPK